MVGWFVHLALHAPSCASSHFPIKIIKSLVQRLSLLIPHQDAIAMYEKLIRRPATALHLSVWRALCCLLIILLIAQNLRLWHSSHTVPESVTVLPSIEDEAPAPARIQPWQFVAEQDANNFALDHQQCGAAFPDLYREIERAVHLRKDGLGHIRAADVLLDWRDESVFRALIHENKLRILETRGIYARDAFRERAYAVLQQIHRALLGASAAGESLPTIEFAVNVDDRPCLPEAANDTHVVWSFARNLGDRSHDRAWLMPDFNFWAWAGIAGDFAEFRGRAAQRDAFISDKIPQAVWRGVTWTNPSVRGPLIDVSKGKSWADVEEIHWEDKSNMMPTEDFCRYAFVVHTEGRSWSGRMKYLLQCDSVPVVHEREWAGHYYHLLRDKGENQNFVLVKRDFSDLEKKMKHYLAHEDEAQRISDNAMATFRDRYLTPAAQACYWRRLIKGWSEVGFQPEVWEDVQVNVSGTVEVERKMRGISFEQFILGSQEYPPPETEEEGAR